MYFEIAIGSSTPQRIEFELFADTNPRAAENFRALCCNEKLSLVKTRIFKVVPGMFMQGGDLLNEGSRGTGTSIYGGLFSDENFSRRHAGPGLLSMVTKGKDTNGSQFRVSFNKIEEFNGVSQVIGQVVSGMDVIKSIESIPTDAFDKPRVDIVIVSCGAVVKQVRKKIEPIAVVEPEVVEEEEAPIQSAMASKLAALRLKMNQSRVLNNEAVINEQKKSIHKSEHRQNNLLTEPAYLAEAKNAKKQKREESFGWNVFNPDTLYRAHDKRTAAIGPNVDAYKKHKDAIAAGELHKPTEDAKNRVAEMMAKVAENKSKFSRRRAFNEDDDVDYISERNRHFNKKIERSFGQATASIRENIERGSAI